MRPRNLTTYEKGFIKRYEDSFRLSFREHLENLYGPLSEEVIWLLPYLTMEEIAELCRTLLHSPELAEIALEGRSSAMAASAEWLDEIFRQSSQATSKHE